MIEIPQKSIRNRQILQFKIKFENPSIISEVMMLKYELRLLEMAAIVPISLGGVPKENITPGRRESSQFIPQRQVVKSPGRLTPKKSALKSPGSISITSSITKQIHPTDLNRLLENLKKKKSQDLTPKWRNDMAYLPMNYMREITSPGDEPKRLNRLFQERMEAESRNFDNSQALENKLDSLDDITMLRQMREDLKLKK
jgi:hypothetical protein